MSARYTVRPLSDRSWLRPRVKREATRFRASWPDTEQLLLAEVALLDGRDLVIGVDVSSADLRLDGRLQAHARAESPAVEVAFTGRHGPLLYRCDRYQSAYYDQGPDWRHNVRAIALTLESLRAIDRYGASGSGQQYQGWAALPAAPEPMTRAEAEELVWTLARLEGGAGEPSASVVRRAQRYAHPVAAGDRVAWDQLEQALRVLGTQP